VPEGRANRVGRRSPRRLPSSPYADLFSREQLDLLKEKEGTLRNAGERERLHRLRKSCEGGLLARSLAALMDEVQNEVLAIRVDFRGETIPLRTAEAKLAVLDEYEDREELGEIHADATATMNERRLGVAREAEALRAELSGIADPVVRSEDDKGISLRQLADVLSDGNALVEDAYAAMRERWLDRILGGARPPAPSSYHAAYVRRLSTLKDTYPRDRSTRSASRRSPSSVSISAQTRTSSRISKTGPRRRRARASSRPTRRPSSTSSRGRREGCPTTAASSTRPGTRSTTRAATPICRTPSVRSRATTP
jgi:hypothetical protein